MPNLSSSPEADKYLSDLSPKDSRWDLLRASSSRVADLFQQAGKGKYHFRLSACSRWLEFALTAEGDLKLYSARFCRVRLCPVCQWRRSLAWVARLFHALPQLLDDYQGLRFAFLTLTVRNCPLEELRATVADMNTAWQRLAKRKAFPALGFLKSLEVTRGADGSAHPHFHILLILPSSYFTGKCYLSQVRWTELWAKSLRVDYTPVVNIKAIKPKANTLDSVMSAVVEVCKYSVKPSDLVSDSQWLSQLADQLHKTRAVSVGGILRDYVSESEPEDLISEAEDLPSEVLDNLVFGWREIVSRYVYIE